MPVFKKYTFILLLSVLSALFYGCDTTSHITVEESSNPVSASVTYETPVNTENN